MLVHVGMCVYERECVCLCERCVCDRERESVSKCVCERKILIMSVSVCL